MKDVCDPQGSQGVLQQPGDDGVNQPKRRSVDGGPASPLIRLVDDPADAIRPKANVVLKDRAGGRRGLGGVGEMPVQVVRRLRAEEQLGHVSGRNEAHRPIAVA